MAESTKFVDYYKVLGVPVSAGPAQIRAAYIRMAKQHHPDVGGSNAAMLQFNTAYKTLISASSRKAYDMLYDFHTGNSVAHYHDDGKRSQGSSLDDMSDDEIDSFINAIYAEYRAQPKPKVTMLTRLKKMFYV